ncbi:expressed unknown protein [Seminavis robusta]|uniref:Uncharacterized protein n=1 Tax=Seminavis robusta TaxID=568900 RepID=A0A9N8DBD0_9STRA|nr:expressed unknown protein [Seminavis robusta]|eukprot:Sro75_g041000.1 n/a (434) ;mRNA; f:9155-10456
MATSTAGTNTDQSSPSSLSQNPKSVFWRIKSAQSRTFERYCPTNDKTCRRKMSIIKAAKQKKDDSKDMITRQEEDGQWLVYFDCLKKWLLSSKKERNKNNNKELDPLSALVLASSNDTTAKELYEWLIVQLQAAQNGVLCVFCVKYLVEIGVGWNEIESVWVANYQRLQSNHRILKDGSGNTNAIMEKNKLDESPAFQNWIMVQKVLSDKGILLPGRKGKLVALAVNVIRNNGHSTNTTKPAPRSDSPVVYNSSSNNSKVGNSSNATTDQQGTNDKVCAKLKRLARGSLPPKKRKFFALVSSEVEEEGKTPKAIHHHKRSKSPNDVMDFGNASTITTSTSADGPVGPASTESSTNQQCWQPPVIFHKQTLAPALEEFHKDLPPNDVTTPMMRGRSGDSVPERSIETANKKVPLTQDVWDEGIQAAHDFVNWYL